MNDKAAVSNDSSLSLNATAYMQRHANKATLYGSQNIRPVADTNDCSNNPTLKQTATSSKRLEAVRHVQETDGPDIPAQRWGGARETRGDKEVRLAHLTGKSETTTRLRDASSKVDGTLDALPTD